MKSIEFQNVCFWRPFRKDTHIARPTSWFSSSERRLIIDKLTVSINQGERVGLIGANGAGKSTILRLFAGIFDPDSGSFIRPSDCTALLDGFFGMSPDLSGRTNASSRLRMAGVQRDRTRELVGDIEEFSQLGDYFDQPIRTYSNGMLTRLIFSLMTCYVHDTFIIDEGFGVVDNEFKDRATHRLMDIYAQTSTVIIASHNPEILLEQCSRGLVIAKGQLVYDGRIDDALEVYRSH
jgi:lipopolysaccharide transport system ATP-binding protein